MRSTPAKSPTFDPWAEVSDRLDKIVTHNMQQAGVGRPGRLVEIDDTEKIFSNPGQQATEDYISGRFGCPVPRAALI